MTRRYDAGILVLLTVNLAFDMIEATGTLLQLR